MSVQRLSFTVSSPDETTQRATALGQNLGAGDVLLLDGDVGAGKTHFARSLIQSLLSRPEDVPSPTFTLVQTYASDRGEICHADLYRLTSTHEIEELGLTDAFETDICLIEWPDRLGELTPEHALTLHFTPGAAEDTRKITAEWTHDKWRTKLKGWS